MPTNSASGRNDSPGGGEDREQRQKFLKRKQIDLPFSQSTALTDDQLQKMLVTQARRIPIMDWEMQLMLQLCTKKKCFDKGLAILYEYAGHLDTVKLACDRREAAAAALFQNKMNQPRTDAQQEKLLVTLAECNLRTLICLGSWRQRQWSPKTVLSRILTSGSDEDANDDARVALEAALREEARVLSENFGSACEALPAHLTAILLAPGIAHSDMIHRLGTPDPASLEPVVCAIRNIVSIEDDITTAYRVVRTTMKAKRSSGDAPSASPFNDFPTLRLAYPDFNPPNTYAWFGRALEVYKSSVDILEAFRKVFMPPPSPQAVAVVAPRVQSSGKAPGGQEYDDNGRKIDQARFSDEEKLNVEFAAAPAPTGGSSDRGSFNKGNRPRSESLVTSSSNRPRSSSQDLDDSAEASPAGRTTTGAASAEPPPRPTTSPSPIVTKGRKQSASGGTVSALVTRKDSLSISSREGGATGSPLLAGRKPTLRAQGSTSKVMKTSGDTVESGSPKTVPDEAADDDGGVMQSTPSKSLHGGPVQTQLEHSAIDWLGNRAGGGVSGAARAASPDIKKRLLNTPSGASAPARSGATSPKRSNASDKQAPSPLHPAKLSKVLSTKTQQALTYINLSSGYSRGEARAESQALRIAIAQATIPGEKLVSMAARKIQAWWFLMGPRQLLKRRMRNRKLCRGIVYDLVNASIMQSLKLRRKKAHLMRSGATITIQRLVKHWFYVVRRRQAPPGGWGRGSRGGGPPEQAVRTSAVVRVDSANRQDSGSKVIRVDSGSRHDNGSKVSRVASNKDTPRVEHADKSGRKRRRWNRLLATVVLQGFARIIAAKKRVRKVRKEAKEGKGRGSKKKKKVSTYTYARASIILQSFARSMLSRLRVLRMIRAGSVINSAYRVHRAFKRLRGDLRRVEKPARITVHGIRNLPAQVFAKGAISVKISAYWSSLLHIFTSHVELKGVIRGKKPQWTGSTKMYPIIKQLTEDELLHLRDTEVKQTKSQESSRFLNRVSSMLSTGSDAVAAHKLLLEFQISNLNKLKSTVKPILEDSESDDSDASSAKTGRSEESESSPSGRSEGLAASKPQAIIKPSAIKNASGSDTASNNSDDSDRGKSPIFPKLASKENRTMGRAEGALDQARAKYCASFDNELVRIPCLHGNSIVKFEFVCSDGSVIGESLLFLSSSKGLMYWGGETSCQIMYKSQKGHHHHHGTPSDGSDGKRDARRTDIVNPTFDLMDSVPSLEMNITCGVPMMSRCGYAKVRIAKSGPMKSSLYLNFGILSALLTSWHKFYLSLDGEYLSFFESKHSPQPFYNILVKDLISCVVLSGKPTSASNAPFEDTHDVVIATPHEKIMLRFSDIGNRVFWNEVIVGSIRGISAHAMLSRNSETVLSRNSSEAHEESVTGESNASSSKFFQLPPIGGAIGLMSKVTNSVVPSFLKFGADSGASKGKGRSSNYWANSNSLLDSISSDISRDYKNKAGGGSETSSPSFKPHDADGWSSDGD